MYNVYVDETAELDFASLYCIHYSFICNTVPYFILQGQLNEDCSKPAGSKVTGAELASYGHLPTSLGEYRTASSKVTGAELAIVTVICPHL